MGSTDKETLNLNCGKLANNASNKGNGSGSGSAGLGALLSLKGMAVSERIKSFVDNNWVWLESPNACTPKALAMAGLMYSKGKGSQVQCCVCLIILDNLKPDSDPWALHARRNKNCPYILLGKRTSPKEYTVEETIELFQERQIYIRAIQLKNEEMGNRELEMVQDLCKTGKVAASSEQSESDEPEQ